MRLASKPPRHGRPRWQSRERPSLWRIITEVEAISAQASSKAAPIAFKASPMASLRRTAEEGNGMKDDAQIVWYDKVQMIT